MGLNRWPLSAGNVGRIWRGRWQVATENGDARHDPYKDDLAMMQFGASFRGWNVVPPNSRTENASPKRRRVVGGDRLSRARVGFCVGNNPDISGA
jgi:hypothetical protein